MTSRSDPTLERIARRIPIPEPAYERLLARRERKRRNQRIAAGSVAIVLFAAAAWFMKSEGLLERTNRPIAPVGTAIDPSWVTRLNNLTDAQAVRDLFQVVADDSEYWRMSTLDLYDGEIWTRAAPDGSEGRVVLSTPAILPRSDGGSPPGSETLNQTFRILGDLGFGHALPMAQTAEEIAGPIGDVTWDPDRSEAFIGGDFEAGMTYTVRSRIVVPTPEELDKVVHLAPRAYGEWTQLPTDLDPRIQEIAQRWTADATSDYRKVLAIQQHFHTNRFAYDTAVDTSVDADGLLEFLTQTRAGFCGHYASAMAVMVRALGLPARIGVGFRPGTQQVDGSYLVQTDDLYSWVEVLFPGYGWLQFDPTPGPAPHPNAQAGTYLNPLAPTDAS
jgi:transglutaminase-like putative cysteine protease